MASKAAIARLRKEFKRLEKEPVEHIEAVPLESNLLEWHYVVTGPPSTPYAGGKYHGKLVFPTQYPYKPPAIYMTTPNGRFKTNTRLCLSMSDFHPETWNPLWSVASILSGLLSFMLENSPTYGSIDSSDEVKRQHARLSMAFNLRDPVFIACFPHYAQQPTLPASSSAPASTSTSASTRSSTTSSTSTSTSASTSTSSSSSSSSMSTSTSTSTSTLTKNDPSTSTSRPPAPPPPPRHRDDLTDRFVMLIVVVTIAFAISFLYR